MADPKPVPATYLQLLWQDSLPSSPSASESIMVFNSAGKLQLKNSDSTIRTLIDSSEETFWVDSQTTTRVAPDASSDKLMFASLDNSLMTRFGVASTTFLFGDFLTGATMPTPQTGVLFGISQYAHTSGTASGRTMIRVNGGVLTGQNASVEITDINLALNRNITRSTGDVTDQRSVRIQAPTFLFAGSSTITNASTVAISGAPSASTNATITNAYAMLIESGMLGLKGTQRFLGSSSGYVGIVAPATVTSYVVTLPDAAPASNGYALTGQTDGTTNWTAISSGGYATIKEEGGSSLTARTTLNFIGNGLTAADSPDDSWTNITLADAGASSAGVLTTGIQTLAGPKTFTGLFTIAPAASTSGSPTLFTLTGPAHTTLATTVEASDINLNLARTVEFATGAITNQRAVRIQAPTYGFVGSSTITNAATLAISGAPVAGTNATLTNRYALWIESGNIGLAGQVINTQGTLTAVTPALSSTATWNSSTTVFNHIFANITDTASSGNALFMNLQVGSATKFSIDKNGRVNAGGSSRRPTGFTGKGIASFTATGTVSTSNGGVTITGVGTLFLSELSIGDQVTIGSNIKIITAIASDTSATIAANETFSANSAVSMTVLPGLMRLDNSSNATKVVIDGNGVVSFGGNTNHYGLANSRNKFFINPTSVLERTAIVQIASTTNDEIGILFTGEPTGNFNLSKLYSYRNISNVETFYHNTNNLFYFEANTPPFYQHDDQYVLHMAKTTTFYADSAATSRWAGGSTNNRIAVTTTSNGALERFSVRSANIQFTNSISGTVATPTTGRMIHFIQGPLALNNNNILTITGGAITAQTASTEVVDVNFALNRTVEISTGALTTQRAIRIQPPTYAFVGSSTITTAATLCIEGAPATGTNATITNSYAFWVSAGRSLFDGAITMAASTTSNASYRVPAGAAPTSPVVNDYWIDSTWQNEVAFIASIKQVRRAQIYQQCTLRRVTATTSETSMIGTGKGTNTLPANFLLANKRIKITAFGYLTTDMTNPTDITFKVKLGATTLSVAGAQAMVIGVVETAWRFEADIMMTDATTALGFITFLFNDKDGTAATGIVSTVGDAADNDDTVVPGNSLSVDATVQFSAGDAGNDFGIMGLDIYADF